MRTTRKECGHCGIDYTYYLSGMSPEHNSDKYCQTCEKARDEAVKIAFSKIEVLFERKFIETDSVTLDELLEAEKEIFRARDSEYDEAIKRGEVRFPIARRIFASLYNQELGEHGRTSQVEYNGDLYGYSYYPSEKHKAVIKVKKRVNLKTGEILR